MITFEPANLRGELSEALLLITERSNNLLRAEDFSYDLVDINDPDFDPEEHDVVITRDTSLSISPPGSDSSFDTTYGSFIEMFYEARWAKIDPAWRLCL